MNLQSIKISVVGIVLVFLSVTYACKDNPTQASKEPFDPAKYEEPLIVANKHLVRTEDERINDYIERYNWKMETTGTGLRYMIYHSDGDELIEMGDTVKYNYNISLLTGELCYSSETEGSETFILGKEDKVDGLLEGILLLRLGNKAKFIIPSHLAFGLLGDENKIPQKAVLVYDIEILEKQ